MSNLKDLRSRSQAILFAITEDPAPTAQEYLTSLRPEILALLTAECLTIIAEVALLNDYDVGDFSGTS